MPIGDSPQAVGLRTKRSARQLIEAAVSSGRGNEVLGPNIVVANGVACPKRNSGVVLRQLQNCGSTVVKYLIDNNKLCDANNFHGILAGGAAADDGLGSVWSFNGSADRISIYATTGAPRVAVLEIIVDEV